MSTSRPRRAYALCLVAVGAMLALAHPCAAAPPLTAAPNPARCRRRRPSRRPRPRPLLAQAAAPKPGSTLNVAIQGDPQNLDPATTSGSPPAIEIIRNIYRGLVTNKIGTNDKGQAIALNEYAPDLAESWELAEGRQASHLQAAQGPEVLQRRSHRRRRRQVHVRPRVRPEDRHRVSAAHGEGRRKRGRQGGRRHDRRVHARPGQRAADGQPRHLHDGGAEPEGRQGERHPGRPLEPRMAQGQHQGHGEPAPTSSRRPGRAWSMSSSAIPTSTATRPRPSGSCCAWCPSRPHASRSSGPAPWTRRRRFRSTTSWAFSRTRTSPSIAIRPSRCRSWA